MLIKARNEEVILYMYVSASEFNNVIFSSDFSVPVLSIFWAFLSWDHYVDVMMYEFQ